MSTLNEQFYNKLINRAILVEAGPKPLPLVGNLKDLFLGKVSFSKLVQRIYEQHHGDSVIGMYMGREPVLVLTDLDLIKDVLIKDFAKFPDRDSRQSDKREPLSQNLIKLEAARWRPLRQKLSTAFTSGKLKNMFYLMLECGDHLEEYLTKFGDTNDAVECGELAAKYTTDVIGSCVFGIRTNALADENSEFRRMGRDVFNPNWKNFLRTRVRESIPWLYSILAPFISDSTVTNFFMNIMKETIDFRKKHRIVKHDFIDLIVELRDHPNALDDIELSDSLLTAQLCVFFLAGFETSSTTMSHALYELAQHQPMQEQLRDEINCEVAKNDGELTFEVIKSMKYLDMVFKETLRKYPPATTIVRRSTGSYEFSGTRLTIPKGTRILVPVFSIHRDSRIHSKPEAFDPERFKDEAVNARHPMSWLAFGNGPRNCIGARFAAYQSKVGLIKILQKHKVEVCEKTRIPYAMNTRSFLLAPADGIHLKISKII
ncbi:probable cytochrome P450 6a14 isoform X2 [Venturia canescens]|uniref:probable cytochrome P450 6a14 isoform X2 n=1 Tax=Venturia canescens TaxID=32260 RepID=UPI001C9BD111|nr:probable cytochrome P450 6a14 isoform X2 [Venturia canescens]